MYLEHCEISHESQKKKKKKSTGGEVVKVIGQIGECTKIVPKQFIGDITEGAYKKKRYSS